MSVGYVALYLIAAVSYWLLPGHVIRLVAGRGTELHPLRVLGGMPMTGTSWAGGGACLPAVTMAVEDINQYPGLLDGYNFTYHYFDTKCAAGISLFALFDALHNDPPYTMFLGCTCSVCSEATAQVTYLWNLTQISHGSSSPILSNRHRFPRFFRLASPDQQYNEPRIALMKMFNWKKVATINQALEFFSVVIDDFITQAEHENISIISQEIFDRDPAARIRNLAVHDARIIVTACYEDKAREILCAAYKAGLYGPRVIWFFVGWFATQFWTKNLQQVDCTAEQMSLVIEGAFLTLNTYENNFSPGIANMSGADFHERYYQHPLYDKDKSDFDFVALSCYDNVWVSALGLNCTDTVLKNSGSNSSLTTFTYADRTINDAIFDCVSNLSFVGMGGRIEFSDGADTIRDTYIRRVQGGQTVDVAVYVVSLRPPAIRFIDGALRWAGGVIPRDSTLIQEEEVHIPVHLYAIMSSLAGIGIVIATIFLTFNVKYRHNRVVKMSSPNINNVLLLGCVTCYITVFLKPTETDSDYVCKARTFCFALGFTTAFGALFSKTWRVYRVFTNKKLLKRTIKDLQLLVIIFSMVVVVLVVLIVWEIIGPQKMIIESLNTQFHNVGNDVQVHPFVRICHSDWSLYFGWALYVIEGALLSFGAFLAWETRHVKIEALNDSHEIGLCLYNVVILSAVGLTMTLLLSQQVVILYGITSGCVIIGTTVTQIVVFAPKILHVHHGSNSVGVATTNPNSIAPSGTAQSAVPPSATLSSADLQPPAD